MSSALPLASENRRSAPFSGDSKLLYSNAVILSLSRTRTGKLTSVSRPLYPSKVIFILQPHFDR